MIQSAQPLFCMEDASSLRYPNSLFPNSTLQVHKEIQKTARVPSFNVFEVKVKSLNLMLNKVISASGGHVYHMPFFPFPLWFHQLWQVPVSQLHSLGWHLSHTLLQKCCCILQQTAIPVSPPVKLMPNSPLPFVWIPACPHMQPPGTSVPAAQPHSSFLNYMDSKAFNTQEEVWMKESL